MLTGSGPLLMVDDDRADIYIAKMCLQRSILKKEIQALDSGEALIKYLEETRDRNELPCLILLDINMPGLDGFETLARVRKMRGFECLPPVTILSSSDDPRDIERGTRLGAAYVTKPMGMEDYVEFFDSLAA